MSTEVATTNGTARLPAWMMDLRSAIAESITSDDLKQMVQAQVKKAKQGDAKACKFVIDLLGGTSPPSQKLVQNNYSVTVPDAPRIPSADLRDRIWRLLEKRGPLTPGQIAANLRADHDAVALELSRDPLFVSGRGDRFAVAAG